MQQLIMGLLFAAAAVDRLLMMGIRMPETC
jgi:hypothetical protein